MVRIAGVNLPGNKRMEIALTYVYGIGRKTSKKILSEVGISLDVRAKDLTEGDEKKLRDAISKHVVEGDLTRKRAMDIKRLQQIGSYRGYRHRRGLPCRGQRTQCNSRTRRGRKKSTGVGSGKRKDSKK